MSFVWCLVLGFFSGLVVATLEGPGWAVAMTTILAFLIALMGQEEGAERP